MLDAAIEVAGKGYNNTATALFQYYVTNFGVLNEVGAAVPNDLSWIVAFELANSIFEKKLAANIAEKFGRC